MRPFISAVCVLMIALCRAEEPRRYAASDRVVTIEQWGARSRVATVWAVTPSKIIVFRIEPGVADKLLAEIPISADEKAQIQRLVAGIDSKSRGKVWFPPIDDGFFLRVSFTQDGALRDDRIEIWNHWREEFASLLTYVSERMPEGARITFKAKLEEWNLPRGAPIEVRAIRDYYGVK